MRRSDSSGTDTRNEILFTASKLFMQKGYAKTKVLDIARQMQINPSALYWHFESKEEILFEYLKSSIEEFNRLIAEALEGLTEPEEMLHIVAKEHTAAQLMFRERAQTVISLSPSSTELMNSLSKENNLIITDLYRIHIDTVRSIITRGIEKGIFHTENINALAFAILNMCEYVTLWYRPEGSDTIESVANANAEFALRMAMCSSATVTGVNKNYERFGT